MTLSQHQPARVGLRLRGWAERHCSPEVMEGLVLPIIADLQYEDATAEGNTVVRWLGRFRSYLAFAKAIGLHYVVYGRLGMRESNVSPRLKALDYLRVILVVPAVYVATCGTQYVLQSGLPDLMFLGGAGSGWQMWAWETTKSTPVQAIIFALLPAVLFATVWCVVPPAARDELRLNRTTVMIGVCVLGVLWSAAQISPLAGPLSIPLVARYFWKHPFSPMLVQAVMPWLGGCIALWLMRRARQEARPTHSFLRFARLGLMIPAALLSAGVAEVMVMRVAKVVLVVSGASRSWEQALYASAFWIASPFMAAMFVVALYRVAPPARRSAVVIGASGAVVLWGAVLIFAAISPWAGGVPRFGGWPAVSGFATWLSGAGVLWLFGSGSPRAA